MVLESIGKSRVPTIWTSAITAVSPAIISLAGVRIITISFVPCGMKFRHGSGMLIKPLHSKKI